MERMRGQGGVYGGVFFLFRGGELNDKKITKIKYDKGLRWPLFDILHATTNQKQASMTEGGWDRPRDRARMLRECDGKDKPLVEGNNNDNDVYNKDTTSTPLADGVEEPLNEGDDKYETLSAAVMKIHKWYWTIHIA